MTVENPNPLTGESSVSSGGEAGVVGERERERDFFFFSCMSDQGRAPPDILGATSFLHEGHPVNKFLSSS